MLWCAILLLGQSWLFAMGWFESPSMVLWGWSVAAALVLSWLALWRQSPGAGGWGVLRAGCRALIFCGGILAAQLVLFVLFERWVIHYGPLGTVARLLAPLVKLTGLDAAAQNGIVYVQTFHRILPVSVTLEKLGAWTICSMLASVLVFPPLKSRGPRWRAVLSLMLMCLAYVVLRFLFLVVLMREYKSLEIFWNVPLLTLEFLPLTILLTIFHPLRDAVVDQVSRASKPRFTLVSSGIAAGLALFITCLLGYLPRGETKQGRVMIDDAHSRWAWTDIRMGREDFGQQPTYTYSALKNYLEYYYDLRVNADRDISEDLLRDVDVLVLKTPTRPFTPVEAAAISNFVNQGGGLFLIGDHNNLFGMSTHMNPIAAMFGIRFLTDDTFDLTTGTPTSFRPPRLFAHPIVQRVNELGFETSCTLAGSPFAEHVILGTGLGREHVDYAHINFFGNIQPDLEEGYGVFAQGLAVRKGRGRVAAFSDSTVFSNFSLFQRGRLELFMGYLEYLNGRNRTGPWTLVFLGGLVAVLGFAWMRRHDLGAGAWVPPWIWMAAALGMSGGSEALRWIHLREYQPARPRTALPSILFDREISQYRLPSMLEYTPPDPTYCFDTFYVNMLRLDRFPKQVGRLEESLASGSPVVLINPVAQITPTQAEAFRAYLNHGGRAMVMVGSDAGVEGVNRLLAPCGLRVDVTAPPAVADGLVRSNAPPPGSIAGGTPVAIPSKLLPEHLPPPAVSVADLSAGRLLVVVGAEVLSREHIGQVFNMPDANQQSLYRLQYFLLDRLFSHE